MRIAELPTEATDIVKKACNDYIAGLGRRRLPDVSRLSARGVISEALLDLETVSSFLLPTAAFDSFFTRFLVFLFDGDQPIGSIGVEPDDNGFRVDHVTLGAIREIVDGLTAAEQLPGSAAAEARLVHVPPIYLKALVLVQPGVARTFLVLSPPYRAFSGPLDQGRFGQFVKELLEEHRRLFPLR